MKCAGCDAELEGRRTKWCSTRCCGREKWRRYEDTYARWATASTACFECGATLPTAAGRRGVVRVFCSQRCTDKEKSRRATAKRRGATVLDRVSVFDVGERDGWICQGCMNPVDRALRWPNRGALSFDHRVPVSDGGEHTFENLQVMHFGCLRKGTRPHVPRSVWLGISQALLMPDEWPDVAA